MTANQELVTLFVPGDPTELALAESLLRERDIPYSVKNKGVQNLFGAGEIGGYNLAVGSEEIQVFAVDLERSKALIAEALGEEAAKSAVEGAAGEAPSPLEEQLARYSRNSLLLGVFWFWGVGALLAVYFGVKALSLARQSPGLSTTRAKLGIGLGVAGLILCGLYWGFYLLG